MNKKLIRTSLALMLGIASFSATNAFFGGQGGGQEGPRGEMHHQMEMTQEKFDEMKALFNKYTNVADFIEARKALHEEHKAEREAMKESVTKSVEKITNGVKVTITSTNSDVVEKIQSREQRDPRNENITKTVEKISNGVIMTITSDDAGLVKKIQSHEERDGSKRGERKNFGQNDDGEDSGMTGKRMNKKGRFAKFRQRLMEKLGIETK